MSTLSVPRILLPNVADMSAWAVVACDQFTSDEEYWRNLRSFVGNRPSTLNLIFPEIFLGFNDEGRIKRIDGNMREYLDGGLFREEKTLVLVERTTQSGTRTGIVLAVDLEDYSFERHTGALIRSTEETIAERIPPRVAIRKDAPIELPHIMLLYDDASCKVVSSVVRGKKLYDFELNMGGGHVVGTAVANPDEVLGNLYSLADMSADAHGGEHSRPLFLVGDGNHSLAAAKACWEEIKVSLSQSERLAHPARYALVEVVNLYDGALRFEPIHRMITTQKPDLFVKGLDLGGDAKAVVAVGGRCGAVRFPADIPAGIRALDEYIASFIQRHGGSVDYIHGKEMLKSLSRSGVGIILPPVAKDRLFSLVASGGNLPRKTFSMGDGNEKRYYIEAKAIR